ncbi:MAG: TPM domain-containing protein [Thermoanaerobaculia bacterium]
MFRASWLLILVTATAWAQDYAPYPKPDAGYVTDHAQILNAQEEERIEQWLLDVEKKSGTEIIVVTIPALAAYPGTANESIERFSTALFNRWGVGNRATNDGILLVVALGDRKARIELGDGHPPARDAAAAAIMANTIVPRFRSGDYAAGITNGVTEIVHQFTPVRITFRWSLVVVPLAALALLATGISLVRHGKRGWGWVLIGLALVVIVAFLYVLAAAARRRTRSSGWSAGGLGGFGGGFSSGRGATGSW